VVPGLFVALALLHLVPLWLGPYLPTMDGACHVYNAWILRGLAVGDAPPAIREHYEINARPYPNWLGHAALAVLISVVPPPVAEKVVASSYVLLLLGGVWYLAGLTGPGERWRALLVLPLVYNQPFQYGFYNFSLSLALFPWVLAVWWRYRDRPGWALALRLHLLLLLTWFAHPLSFGLAVVAIAVLWLATLSRERWRGHLLHVTILAPQAVLPAWFLANRGAAYARGDWDLERMLRYFARLEVLATLDPAQGRIGLALAVAFLVVLLRTLWVRGASGATRRPADVFLLLAGLAFVLFLASPQQAAGGALVKQRLSLYPYLLLIPGLAPGWRVRTQHVAAAALAALALAGLGLQVRWYRERGAELASFVAGMREAPAGARILVLLFERRRPIDTLSHAAGYAAAANGLIDWDNYEARHAFFPTRFRSTVVFPHLPRALGLPPRLHVVPNWHLIDAVYTWKMPDETVQRRTLHRWYRRVSRHEAGGELWVKRRSPRAEPARRPRADAGELSAPARDRAAGSGRPAPRAGAAPTRGPRSARAAPR
jgi:hypothetical protein